MQQLKKDDIKQFIIKQLTSEAELAKKIIKSIDNNKSKHVTSFLVNPLLLSLYILTFQSNAEIPNKKYIFYGRVINALFSEHDSKTKLGFVRQKLSGLNQEQFEEILKIFCYISYYESEFSWEKEYVTNLLSKSKKQLGSIKFDNELFIKDLKSAVALWTEDNGVLSFAHRSLQEYFAALFVKSLPQDSSELIYSDIKEKFGSVNNFSESENFLSLCEEMDTLNYKKFHYLPLLKELRAIIKKTSDRALVKSFIEYFISSIRGGSSNIIAISVNNNVYRTIHIHLKFTQQLHDILSGRGRRRTTHKDFSLLFKKDEQKNDDYNTEIQILKKTKAGIKPACPKNLLDFYFEDALSVSKEFSEFIDSELEKTQGFIQNKESIGTGIRALLNKAYKE